MTEAVVRTCVHCDGSGMCQKYNFAYKIWEYIGKARAWATCSKCGDGATYVEYLYVFSPKPSKSDKKKVSGPVCAVCGGKGLVSF